ncbi:hypothetical protein [Curtobacterium ammoniigenes]|uniref:hypothetical protein n=1 Tax=Curtobacterium ammoniigenes TaxID=395387 RepID=UPI00082A1439|nr:hypothetical protein [Curtobacterium ammoniigenes]
MGGGLALIVAAGIVIVVLRPATPSEERVAGPRPNAVSPSVPAQTPGDVSTASGSSAGGNALEPAGGSGSAAPAAPTITRSQQQLLRYVARLPTVHDITPVTVADYTDLVCATLGSPHMSPTFFQSAVQIEERGYGLTYQQTIGLLTATAQSGCPSELPVIQRRGATTD